MGWKIGDKITVDPTDNDLVLLEHEGNAGNSTFDRMKKYLLGDETLKTTAQTIKGAINENTTQLSDITNHLNAQAISIDYMPSGFTRTVGNANYQKSDGTWWQDSGFTIPATDDTLAIQQAINYCVANNYKTLLLGAKRYLITDTLQANGTVGQNNFFAVEIVGVNKTATWLVYPSFTTKKAAIKYQGGSANLTYTYPSRITFKGSNTSVAIEINSQDGVIPFECEFLDNAVGVLFSNDSVGGFTECCYPYRCRFQSSCLTAIEYYKGQGTDSFHGSGIKECHVNTKNGNSSVIIGNGCRVYNAPLSLQVWSEGDYTVIVVKNDSNITPQFH